MTDSELILAVGVGELAKLLKFSPQRVSNWRVRGIPARVKLEHKRLFASLQRRRNIGLTA